MKKIIIDILFYIGSKLGDWGDRVLNISIVIGGVAKKIKELKE